MRTRILLGVALLLLLPGPTEARGRRPIKGYSFPLATFAEGGNAEIFRKYMRQRGIKVWQEDKDFGFIVHAGRYPDEGAVRYLEPFFALRTREYADRVEAEQKASFARDRNFPAMVDSRYDIAKKARVYWVYIGYGRTRAEAQEVLRGFSYYPDVGDYLESTDAEDESVVVYAGGYLAHPNRLFASANLMGDRRPELIIQEERSNEYELFSEVAPPSNKPVEVLKLGYKGGPMTHDLGVYYFDDLAGGWKKAGVMPVGADPMTFKLNADLTLLYRDLDDDKEQEIVVRAKRQDRDGATVCTSQDMLWIYDLVQDGTLRDWRLVPRYAILDRQGGKLYKALAKNKKWRGGKAIPDMLDWASRQRLPDTALSLYAGLLDQSAAAKVEYKKRILRQLRRAAGSGKCQRPKRCGRSPNTYSWEHLGPVVQRLVTHYTGDKDFFDMLAGLASECKKCQGKDWTVGDPHCGGFYRALGLVQPEKGEELSRAYFREGMQLYVKIDEDEAEGPQALLNFLLAAELDPTNGEALYKAACVAAKRNALALAANLLSRAFQESVTYKARARDDDNFADMVRSPQFDDLFSSQ